MDLLTNYKKATSVEKKIIEARCSGLSISQMDSSELISELLSCLISISVISGHSLPEDEVFAIRLNEDLKTQLLFYGYEELTTSEIILAFRLNCFSRLKYPSGSEVEHIEIYGKCLNVDYITKVLNVYMTFRNILDNHLKNVIDGYE